MRKLLFLMIICLLTLSTIIQAITDYDNDLKMEYYWTAPATGNVHHYEVQISTDNGVSWTSIGNTTNGSAPTIDNRFSFTGTASKTYLVRVRVVNASNASGPWSVNSDPTMETPGDANFDGQVELTDFTLVSRYWLRSKDDSNYNPSADLNDDGIVNIDDLSLVTLYWGQVYYNGAPPANDNFLGQLTLEGFTDNGILEIVVKIKQAKEVTSLSFKLVLEQSLELEEIKRTGSGILWSTDNLKKNTSIILMSYGEPQNGSNEIIVAKAKITDEYLLWHETTNIVIESGQIMDTNGKTSRCAVMKSISLRPKISSLGQNYPNPFNPDTWIPYQLAKDGQLVIKIFSSNGQLVRTLDLGYKSAGFYTNKSRAAYWDGKNEAGEKTSSGIYFYTIDAGEFHATRKMIVLK